MKLRDKILHLVLSIKSCWVRIVTAIGLCGFAVCCVLNCDSDSQILAFSLGVVASIVASVILSVSDTYMRSCLSWGRVLSHVEQILLFIDENITDDSYQAEECKYQLWELYIPMCQESVHLTYKTGFSSISKAIDEIIRKVGSGCSFASITEAKQQLVELKKTY